MSAIGNEQNNGSMQIDAVQNAMGNDPNANNQGQPPEEQQNDDQTVMAQTAFHLNQPQPTVL